MRGARRGEVSLLYDALLSLLLLVVFATATYTYIYAKANGDEYFSHFYAEDLSATADAVNAGQGDVVLRYDNIKVDNRLSFWLDNGRISVARAGAVSTSTKNAPPGAATGLYGVAKTYAGDYYIETPTYLVLRKAGGAFGIGRAEGSLRSCPNAPRTIGAQDARILLDAPRETQQAFASVLKGTPFTVVEQQPTIQLKVARATGKENALACDPTDAQGASLCCDIAQQLGAVSAASFSNNDPVVNRQEFTLGMTITTTPDTTLTNEQVGKALAYALAVHYR